MPVCSSCNRVVEFEAVSKEPAAGAPAGIYLKCPQCGHLDSPVAAAPVSKPVGGAK